MKSADAEAQIPSLGRDFVGPGDAVLVGDRLHLEGDPVVCRPAATVANRDLPDQVSAPSWPEPA